MRIAVTANNPGLDTPVNPIFGRCPLFVFVDTETLAWEAAENPALSSAHGAGVQAAQFVLEQGVEAVLAGRIGPNAFGVLHAAQVGIYEITDGQTIRQAVEAFREKRLQMIGAASGPQHGGMSGMGGGRGRGRA